MRNKSREPLDAFLKSYLLKSPHGDWVPPSAAAHFEPMPSPTATATATMWKSSHINSKPFYTLRELALGSLIKIGHINTTTLTPFTHHPLPPTTAQRHLAGARDECWRLIVTCSGNSWKFLEDSERGENLWWHRGGYRGCGRWR